MKSRTQETTEEASPAYSRGAVQNHTASVLGPLVQWQVMDGGKLSTLTDVSP
ncbi:hypothetical protein ACIRU3_42055 [Streptomyces sp. NPDC101151]|uniref:hypothetical protein n=1 Tax=Streptomyces sp. NPDC101151 TaxID=3366115 RepID=UPI0037FE8110